MVKYKSNRPVGIIAEDDSDVESVHILIKRISNNRFLGVKKFIGQGCGKIKKKCNVWATRLKERGCGILIVIHDLDNNSLIRLRSLIEDSLKPCPIKYYLICIPVRELEAWLLSDPNSIKVALKLRKAPKIKGNPENIISPKEYIEKIVYKISNGEKIYMNTKHNEKIAEVLSIEKARRCPSFLPFYDFVHKHYGPST